MLRIPSLVPALALIFLTACGSDNRPDDPNPAPGGETITGRERIGWIQPATDTVELATFGYAMYVDNVRVVLAATCGSTAGSGGFQCSAQLPQPQMTPGAHVLELATFTGSGANVLESARSPALSVNVVSVTTSAREAEASDGASITASDGLHLRASIVARGLDDPTDIAFAPDRRAFLIERRGLVRAVDVDRGTIVDAGRLRDTGELLTLAIDPEFSRSRRLYFVYTAESAGRVTMRLARVTELNGALGQAAVLFEEPVARVDAAAAARFGPDQMLFLGLGDGGDPRNARDASSPLAKILRLTADGTTPRDNPGASAVFSTGHRAPRALAWHPDTNGLWEIERWGAHDILASTDYGWLFPEQTLLAGGAFFRGGPDRAVPHGDLFVASPGAQDLLRVRFADGRPLSRGERLLHGRFGRIGAVAQSPDGALYFTTANRDLWGAGQDLLVRLTQQSAIHIQQ
jgi:glucose/arabinose dehydrogenase